MYSIIPVYKAERDVGLTDIIRSKASVAYASALEPTTDHLSPAKKNSILQAIATNEGQIDLYYLKTVLATVGWNKNDDIFDKVETWSARATPEDKPFNLEHDPRLIRGHITSNYVMGDDGKTIDDDTAIDDLPNKYHIVTNAVLYKFLASKDTELTQEMERIIAEIEKGEWFVSMEALFTNFDYAVISPDGKSKVIPRNEASAFLTKHLRAYGGDGVYEQHKIGRLMRNITFSGKGLVKKPANPESIIFRNVASFNATATSLEKEFSQIQAESGYINLSNKDSNKESDRMADVNPQVEMLQAQVKSLENTIASSQKKNEDLEKRLSDLNEKQVQAKITDLDAQVKSRDEKITALQAQVKTEQDARVTAETQLTEAKKKVTELETEVNTAKAAQVKAGRITKWIDRTGADQAVANKAVESLAKLSDEEFNTFLETQPAKAAAQTPPPVDDKSKGGNTSGSQNANEKVLDNVTPEKDAALASAGVDTGVEQARASVGAFIKKNFLRGGKKNTQTAE